MVNFDFPNSSEDYVHRIGRTARAERYGTSYTFFTPEDGAKAHDLMEVLKEANQQVPSSLLQLGMMHRWDKKRKNSFIVEINKHRITYSRLVSNTDEL